MSERIRYVTRPAHRQQALLAALRQQIIDGSIAPGMRLPPRRELEKQCCASRFTVQAVLDQLVADGFVEVRGRHGTFVSLTPPHRCRYALVFPWPPGHTGWSQFHSALRHEAEVFHDARQRQCLAYYHGTATPEVDGLRAVCADVERQRLAGIMYVQIIESSMETPSVFPASIPKVSIQVGPASHGIVPDMSAFFERALSYLAGLGRRRIAILLLSGNFLASREELGARMATHGMNLERRWVQSVSAAQAGWAENCMALLFHPDQAVRPDGLIIADDNLVPETMQGLQHLGVRVPEDLAVVAHGNFPWLTPSSMPVRRLGFDTRAMLGTCLDILDQLRAGLSVPTMTSMPALFEDEIDDASR